MRPRLGALSVAAFFILLATIAPLAASDIIVKRDGTKLIGNLRVCSGGRCHLDSQTVLRDTIAWIGFAYTGGSPPSAESASEDEIHFGDHSVQTGSLLGISPTVVVTLKSRFARQDVAWIHLAPPTNKPQPHQPVSGAERSPSQSSPPGSGGHQQPPSSGPEPSATTPTPASSRRPSSQGMKPCPADKPLGGRITVNMQWRNFYCTGGQQVTLRFPLVMCWLCRSNSPWSSQVSQGFDAPEINYEISSGGCSGTSPNGDVTCRALGDRKAGKINGRILGTAKSPSYLHFSPVKPALEAKVLPLEIHTAFTTDGKCVGRDSSSGVRWRVGIGGFAIRPEGPSCGSHTGFDACVPPGECARSADAECVTHADRHATLPFSGESQWTAPKASDPYFQGLLSSKIQWDVCCGCGAPSTPPEPSNDPCPSTATADALAQKNRDQRASDKTQLQSEWDAFGKEMAAAQSHLGDFQKSARACNVQQRETKLLIGALGLFSPLGEVEIAEGGVEVAEDIAAAAKELGEMIGDPGKTLAEVTEKILAGEDPTAVMVPNEEFQNFRGAVEQAARAEALLEGANLDQLDEEVQQCAGTIGLSYDTWHGAQQYVENLRQAMSRIPDVQKLVNDIHQLDTDYPNLQYQSWAACVRRARCLGTPESNCADKKPSGNWPPVR